MAITVEGTASTQIGTGVTQLSWTHDSGASGSNAILIVRVAWNAATDTITAHATDPNYNSQTLTLQTYHTAGAGVTMSTALWYLLDPPRGSFTVQVNFSASANAVAGAQTYAGVDQGTPFGTPSTSQSTVNATTYTATVTSAVNELVLDTVCSRGDRTTTVDASQTQEHNTNNAAAATDRRLAASREAGAASVVMSGSFGGGTPYAHFGIPLKPAADATVLDPFGMGGFFGQ